MQYSITFPTGKVQYVQDRFPNIGVYAPKDQTVIITDSNIARMYPELFKDFKGTIVIPAGEASKTWQTVELITSQLIQYEAHRNTFLLGVGGGMVTDITGFIASVYMRGVNFGFVPTSLLGMVDAAIGGKNGINFGKHKNMLGVIQQPQFIFYDTAFLQTLPDEEWSNGFAEIIKYACLFDESMFNTLSKNDIAYYKENENALVQLIEACANFKNKTVLNDEKEQGKRKLLNFGHTTGHAFETIYELPHGSAVALGMIVACVVSEWITELQPSIKNKLAALLLRYQLPITLDFATGKVMNVLRMDKKRGEETVDFVMLTHIGGAVVKPIHFDTIQKALLLFNASRN